jgi:hypothetical protein
MADFDPPSGGSSEWTDTGSALTPTGDETIGDGTDDADLRSLSTNTAYADVSEYGSLQAAIDNAPIPAGDDWVLIDARQSGVVYDSIDVEGYSYPIRILGPTDGSGNPDVTIDAGGTDHAINQLGGHIVLENVQLTGGNPHGHKIDKGIAEYRNVLSSGHSTTSGHNAIQAGTGSLLNLDSDTVIDHTGGQDCISLIQSRMFGNATITGGTRYVVIVEDNGSIVLGSASSIEGEGASTTEACIHVREKLHGKTTGNIQDAETGIYADLDAGFDFDGTYSGLNQLLNIGEHGGNVRNLSDGESRVLRFGGADIRASIGTDQTVADATPTKIAFNQILWDEFSNWDDINNEFVAPTDGRYRINAKIRPNNVPGGNFHILKTVNSGTAQNLLTQRYPNGPFPTVSLSGPVKLTEGDSLHIEYEQSTGGNVTIDSSDDRTYVAIRLDQ